MIEREDNPEFVNSFLDYTVTILNKSPNTVKEYNYDIANFLKYMKKQFKLSDEKDFKEIKINDMDISIMKKITLQDIHGYISYPEITKSNRNSITTLVNGRVIKNNELKLVLNALTEFRNKVIQQGRYADPVDELILKLNK